MISTDLSASFPAAARLAPPTASLDRDRDAEVVIAGAGFTGLSTAPATAMGPELARWAAGTATIDDLALPATVLQPIPGHALGDRLARGMLWLYRRRDAQEV